ncbi:FAD dependent oxidoreductase-like protein [Polyplosphaeria fusca]|uniref:FAD dependent oxidoreductase-like protein n=1 Tax=Polyplosphaeria fusca TaxID=682080 RepID=A0A9P4V3W1_9PLEO|nr:FAD dependent oxidoreductase-like protein [Polyplosphaeria fusca]
MEARAQIPVHPPVPDPLPSYWHSPKSPLANTIEPEPDASISVNPQTYDHAIIGSGISGTAIAYHVLSRFPSAKVIMFEAREACGGATGRNGGHTKAASYRTYLQHREELGTEEARRIAQLEYANILETHRLAKEIKIDCESVLCNTVDIIYNSETFERGEEAISILQADATEAEREEGAMAWYKTYSAPEAQTQFFVAPKNENTEVHEQENVAGAFEYLAGRINAYRFSTGILKDCVKKGLHLCTNTPVRDIIPRTHTSDPNGTLNEIHTSHSTILARNTILATNGYTPSLLPTMQGIIVPMRGQITAQRPGKNTKLPAPLPTTYSFIYKSGYEYMVPHQSLTPDDDDQHIVIGGGLCREPQGGAAEFGTVDDSSKNERISRYLHGSLVGYFGAQNWGEKPGDEGNRVVREWTGIMGDTADGRPFVGKVPGREGVWMSAGFNGHGMVLCLKAAEALVQMVMGREEYTEWFPQSFLLSEERLRKCIFHGRTDLPRVPETRGKAIET